MNLLHGGTAETSGIAQIASAILGTTVEDVYGAVAPIIKPATKMVLFMTPYELLLQSAFWTHTGRIIRSTLAHVRFITQTSGNVATSASFDLGIS
jgi:hypothetical protein